MFQSEVCMQLLFPSPSNLSPIVRQTAVYFLTNITPQHISTSFNTSAPKAGQIICGYLLKSREHNCFRLKFLAGTLRSLLILVVPGCFDRHNITYSRIVPTKLTRISPIYCCLRGRHAAIIGVSQNRRQLNSPPFDNLSEGLVASYWKSLAEWNSRAIRERLPA